MASSSELKHALPSQFRLPPALRTAFQSSSNSEAAVSPSSSSDRRSSESNPAFSPRRELSGDQSSMTESQHTEFEDLLQCMICFEPYRMPKMLKVGNVSTTRSAPHTTNHTPYRTANRTPYRTTNHTPYRTANRTPYRTANHTPYRTTNHTPYRTANHTPYRTANRTPYRTANHASHRTANRAPLHARRIEHTT